MHSLFITNSLYLSSAHAWHQRRSCVCVITYSSFFIHFAFTGETKVIFRFAGSQLLRPRSATRHHLRTFIQQVRGLKGHKRDPRVWTDLTCESGALHDLILQGNVGKCKIVHAWGDTGLWDEIVHENLTSTNGKQLLMIPFRENLWVLRSLSCQQWVIHLKLIITVNYFQYGCFATLKASLTAAAAAMYSQGGQIKGTLVC